MSMIVRPTRPGDGRSIAHVQHVGWLHAYPNEEYGVTRDHVLLRDMEGQERVAKHEQRILENDEHKLSWVSVYHGIIIGWCVAEKHQEQDRNELVSLYVLPSYHGRGVGPKLLQTALAWLGNEKDIFLHVVSYNERAICFYKRFGFEDRGAYIYEQGPFADGTNMPSREMVRPAGSL
jgi:ribosomal protein S18 acetylase RimI-like enzyme